MAPRYFSATFGEGQDGETENTISDDTIQDHQLATTIQQAPYDHGEDIDIQQAIFESINSAYGQPASPFSSLVRDLMQALEASLKGDEARKERVKARKTRRSKRWRQPICPICTQHTEDVSATSCGHLFCGECLELWLEWSQSCPVCRQRFRIEA